MTVVVKLCYFVFYYKAKPYEIWAIEVEPQPHKRVLNVAKLAINRISLNLRRTGQAAPVIDLIASVSSFDENGQGELQLSPDGKKLAFYNRKKYIAGFAHQQIDINLFTLGIDLKSITAQSTIEGTTAGSYGKSSLELSNNEDYLYYNQHGLYNQPETNKSKNVWQQNNSLSSKSPVSNTVYGEVRRSLDGKIYIAKQGSYNNFNYLANENSLMVDSVNLDGNADNYSLSGNLPGQPYRQLGSGELLFSRKLGVRRFEIKDHLGNIREVLGDERITTFDEGGNILTAQADLKSTTDYYPFGMIQPNENNLVPNDAYKFGFNGQEKDDEVTGVTGSHLDFGARIYDSRIGKFLSLDPKIKDYPMFSPYCYAANNPILLIDEDGEGPIVKLLRILMAPRILIANWADIVIQENISASLSAGLGVFIGSGGNFSGGLAVDPMGNIATVLSTGAFGDLASGLGGVDFNGGAPKGNVSLGASINAQVGMSFHNITSVFDLAGKGLGTAGVGVDVSDVLSIGVDVGDNSLGISFGVGLGAAHGCSMLNKMFITI